MLSLAKVKQELTIRLARIEGRIEGMVSAQGDVTSIPLLQAQSEAQAFQVALDLINQVEELQAAVVQPQRIVVNTQAPVSVDPALAAAAQKYTQENLPKGGPPVSSHLPPRLAEKAARIRELKK